MPESIAGTPAHSEFLGRSDGIILLQTPSYNLHDTPFFAVGRSAVARKEDDRPVGFHNQLLR